MRRRKKPTKAMLESRRKRRNLLARRRYALKTGKPVGKARKKLTNAILEKRRKRRNLLARRRYALLVGKPVGKARRKTTPKRRKTYVKSVSYSCASEKGCYMIYPSYGSRPKYIGASTKSISVRLKCHERSGIL